MSRWQTDRLPRVAESKTCNISALSSHSWCRAVQCSPGLSNQLTVSSSKANGVSRDLDYCHSVYSPWNSNSHIYHTPVVSLWMKHEVSRLKFKSYAWTNLPLDVSVSAFLLFLTDWKTPPTDLTRMRSYVPRQQIAAPLFTCIWNINISLYKWVRH